MRRRARRRLPGTRRPARPSPDPGREGETARVAAGRMGAGLRGGSGSPARLGSAVFRRPRGFPCAGRVPRHGGRAGGDPLQGSQVPRSRSRLPCASSGGPDRPGDRARSRGSVAPGSSRSRGAGRHGRLGVRALPRPALRRSRRRAGPAVRALWRSRSLATLRRSGADGGRRRPGRASGPARRRRRAPLDGQAAGPGVRGPLPGGRSSGRRAGSAGRAWRSSWWSRTAGARRTAAPRRRRLWRPEGLPPSWVPSPATT